MRRGVLRWGKRGGGAEERRGWMMIVRKGQEGFSEEGAFELDFTG